MVVITDENGESQQLLPISNNHQGDETESQGDTDMEQASSVDIQAQVAIQNGCGEVGTSQLVVVQQEPESDSQQQLQQATTLQQVNQALKYVQNNIVVVQQPQNTQLELITRMEAGVQQQMQELCNKLDRKFEHDDQLRYNLAETVQGIQNHLTTMGDLNQHIQTAVEQKLAQQYAALPQQQRSNDLQPPLSSEQFQALHTRLDTMELRLDELAERSAVNQQELGKVQQLISSFEQRQNQLEANFRVTQEAWEKELQAVKSAQDRVNKHLAKNDGDIRAKVASLEKAIAAANANISLLQQPPAQGAVSPTVEQTPTELLPATQEVPPVPTASSPEVPPQVQVAAEPAPQQQISTSSPAVPVSNAFALLQTEVAPDSTPLVAAQGPRATPATSAGMGKPTARKPASGSPPPGFQVAKTKRRNAQKLQPVPLTPLEQAEVCLLVANKQSSAGQWSFASTMGGWKMHLRAVLGKFDGVLKGVKRVKLPSEERLCLRAPTVEAQVRLFSALRATRDVRVFSMLTSEQLGSRRVARKFAQQHGVRVVERGTRIGLCGQREQTPTDMPTISLTVSGSQLHKGLQWLLQMADRRCMPIRKPMTLPRPNRRGGEPKQRHSVPQPPPPPTQSFHFAPAPPSATVQLPPPPPLSPLVHQLPYAQETWLPKGGDSVNIPGYIMLEQRRSKGKRGGFAIFVRRGINRIGYLGNDYAQVVDLQLCDGSKLSVVNAYLPPAASARRRRVTEDCLLNAVHEVVQHVPHDQRLVICGDFNARTGCLSPPGDGVPPSERPSTDAVVCSRGRWLAAQWQLWGVQPLNGSHSDSEGSATCHRHNGQSVVDYICVRGKCLHFAVLQGLFTGLSDHSPLICRVEGPTSTSAPIDTSARTVYKWVEGSNLRDYSTAWSRWETFGNDDGFVARFQQIVDSNDGDLSTGLQQIEQFLLQEAIQQGVVKQLLITTSNNPNKYNKQLAPWFTEECRQGRQQYKIAVKQYGRRSVEAREAFCNYRAFCKAAASTFAVGLPDMLKYRPREFWKLVGNHSTCSTANIPVGQFAEHCTDLYYNGALPEEPCTIPPITNITPVTTSEVQTVLQQHFKGRVSSGLCPVPSQVFQHLRGKVLVPLTALINKCILYNNPPHALKEAKLVPLYKGKGSEGDCNNYRALAVMHPLAKLVMGILNQRLIGYAHENQLRAPTQAGFREGYCLEDLVLTLQLLVQAANVQQQSLGMVFVDLQKAYDSVDRVKLWTSLMADCNIPLSFIQCIQNMYADSVAYVNGIRTPQNSVKFNTGVKQGCPMSPLLFSIFFDRVASYLASRQASGEGYGLFKFAALQFAILLFADDAVLLAHDAQQLQSVTNAFSQFCTENNLVVNTQKTKVMLVNCSGDILYAGNKLDQVREFVYLGLLIDAQAKNPVQMLNARLAKSKFAFCKIQTKAKLFGLNNCRVRAALVQSLAISQLLFGSIVWGCLAPQQFSLSHARQGTSALKKLWFECEAHLCNQLHWALRCKRDVRTSLLYLGANCPSVQVLVLKRMFRYLTSVDSNPRFVNEVRTTVLAAPARHFGPNLFKFWESFRAQHAIASPADFYRHFVQLLDGDLQVSQRIQRNGLTNAMHAMLPYMFNSQLRAVPAVLHDTCTTLVRSDSSFVLQNVTVNATGVTQHVFIHNWPSWIRVGRAGTMKQFFTFWYGKGKLVTTCPLCSAECTMLVPHFLSTCTALHSLSEDPMWSSVCALLRAGQVGLVLYAVFPLLYHTLLHYDATLFGTVATVYE